ncbi:MAG: polymer-forming cytoskeletal protein [Gammaproteobacteria bacterium]|nr:polymer-forming cytoskeletal protein [Gammaproteobacteria bacterium]MDH5728755.1 polymer-forming cytoskeletal protein [Gammaproteobacteria bacterium]
MIIIPENTTLKGELFSSGQVCYDGKFEGIGDVKGQLILSKKCVWKGKAIADVIIIEGTVEGDIIARERLEVHENALVTGRIIAPSIMILQGARITGDLKMEIPDPSLSLLTDNKKPDERDAEIETTEPALAQRKIVGE